MCGIAGIVGRTGERNRAALARMSAAMVHRGPDGDGVWESTPDERGQGVMLAHRRLAILDLSPAGAQPMVDPVTGHVIALNGEIYDYRELRARLAAEGQTFASTGDTAVLLRALALHGQDALRSARGMFALAVWDPAARRLLLARDPLGMKPLYVARSRDPAAGWSVAFASELRALLAAGLLGTPRLDPRAAASMAWSGFVVGPATAVEGVELLPPGELRELDASGRELARREFRTLERAGAAPPATAAEVGRALEESVRLHLASDVPLAIFLSAGVDSSAIANLAQRAAGAPVHTFTLAFEEDELNEGPAARRIAQAIGTRHQECVLSEERFVAQLEPALDALDQPTFDALNAYFLSRAIREAGFTVALAGTGGDELFGGYASFRTIAALHRLASLLRWLPRERLAALAALAAPGGVTGRGGELPPQTRWAKLPELIRRGHDLVAAYQLGYALFLPAFQRELVGDRAAGTLVDGLPRELRGRLARELRGRTVRSSVSLLEQRLFLGERLLRDADVASMAASLEQRVPLVDQALHATVDRLPDGARYLPAGRKALLRRFGLAGLDPALFERPKTGFVLPFDRWIRRGLRRAMDGTLCDPAAVRDAGLDPGAVGRLWRGFLDGAPGLYWSRVWSVYVLVRWCQRNGVRA